MKNIFRAILLIAILLAGAKLASALDPPHNVTSDPDINCGQCHYVGTDTPEEDWWDGGYASMDDTPKNRICLGCHNDTSVYNGKVTDKYKTHSSYQFSSVYEFSRQCIDCHNPHYQRHLRIYRSSAFINTGTMIGITADADPTVTLGTVLSKDYENYMFIPNSKYYTLTYKIINSTDGKNSFKIRGPVNLTYAPAGSTYAIVYGRYAHETINGKAVKLFRREGANSLADGDGNYDGVCEVCHTQTQHFRGDGSAPDQKHENLTGVDASSGIYCIQCHSHTGGFAHGGGSGSDSCGDCHGKHADHGGVGTTQSHATHLESDSHGVRGPKLGDTACDECHDTANFPRFKDGQDLAGTTACDPCHSEGGSYNGVDSTGNSIGAKDNWRSGIYIANSVPAEKERWCAGCHDTGTSVINSVSAPPVIGNETASSIYGTGYGYYKTGHGLANTLTYPESGGLVNGAEAVCDDCHDYSTNHIDGLARTYGYGMTSVEYRTGYRLGIVNGSDPMIIPLGGFGINYTSYELCMNCHGDNFNAFSVVDDTTTNFYDKNVATGSENLHQYHLKLTNNKYVSDWSTNTDDSRITCVVCHNVHGSRNLVMIRDGALTGKPSLDIWYKNDSVSYVYPGPAMPSDVTLAASNGVVWRQETSNNYCSNCHSGTSPVMDYYRSWPDVDTVPALDWPEMAGFENGVDPDTGYADATGFLFIVRYSDGANDPPSVVNLLVNTTGGNACSAPGSIYSMDEYEPTDTSYYNGKDYSKTLYFVKDADNQISFCYNSVSGADLATGSPTTSNQSLSFNNMAPVLGWVSNTIGYETDGVSPDQAGAGQNFTFRIKYTDANNDAPGGIMNLFIDGGIYNAAMTALDPSDTDYTDGKIYNATVPISPGGDYSYRFIFNDIDGADATGDGIMNSPVTVTSGTNAPTLAWTGEDGYTTDGVDPNTEVEWMHRIFRVKYTDLDNDAPNASSVQVWVDVDNSSSYEAGEKFVMTEVDSGDTDYSNGKLYTQDVQSVFPGSGVTGVTVNPTYEFNATDTTARAATAIGGTYGITNAIVVPDEETSINTAANRADSLNNTVVVKAGSYTEAVSPNGWNTDYEPIHIRSVDGPEATAILASGAPVILFARDGNNLLQGFTISSSTSYGVQIQDSTNITIDDCILENNTNHAIYGLSGTPVTVTNSIIRDNVSRGIHLNNGNALTLENTAITNNNTSNAATSGAGIFLGSNATIDISSSIINSNHASNAFGVNGGGICLSGGNTMTMTDSIVDDNSSPRGGGIGLCSSCTATISNSTISSNSATSDKGGGIYINGGTLTIVNSTVYGNQSTTVGGGLFSSGHFDAINVTFSGNKALASGGGIYDQGTSNMLFCTISGNYAGTSGGGIYHLLATASTYKNGILYNNAPEQIWTNQAVPTTSMYFTLINQTAGNNSYLNMGGNDIVNSAGFVNGLAPATAPTTDGDYHLKATSSAMDAGSASYPAGGDIDGDSRPQGSGYDMGADEYMP